MDMLFDGQRLIYLLMMPRVVADQRQKFETDDLFVRFSRLSEVRYSGLPVGAESDRRARFLQDCQDGKVEIAFIPSGFNLELHIAPSQTTGLASDFLDMVSDPPKIHICSHFILNGVCVRWRGWLDRTSLVGQGRLEFDAANALIENQRLQEDLRLMQERLERSGQPETSTTSASTARSSATPVPTAASTPPTTSAPRSVSPSPPDQQSSQVVRK